MGKKKIITSMFVGVMLLSIVVPVFAQTATGSTTLREQRKTVLKTIKTAATKKLSHITNGTITAINGSQFTVSADGKTITVTTNNTTEFRRHFWGDSSLSEMSVQDKVNVWGNWTDTNQNNMIAQLVRDLSIMKRRGVFFGTITSKNTNGFVMSTVNRGNQTVTVSSTSKYINRKGQSVSFSTIAVGNKVRVRGMWDKVNSTITEVAEIKDFSVPATTSATPSPITAP